MKNLERYLVTPNPNLSIILPGGCNANCQFCFWKESSKTCQDYPARLAEVLDSLPSEFQQISITGGEPTISPAWSGVIKVLGERLARWPKKVLNTNGVLAVHPEKYYEVVKRMQEGGINHINWSRHACSEAENKKIFNSNRVPNKIMMTSAIDDLAAEGIDVTINTVMGRGIKNRVDLANYIKFAHDVGANAVCLRKEVYEGSDLEYHELEELFADYKEVHSTSCPVCRSRTILFRGCPVTFKAGLMETAKDGIYELILHPDGKLTIDWAAKKVVDDVVNPRGDEFGADDVVDRFFDIEDEAPRKKAPKEVRRKAHKKAKKNTKKKVRQRRIPNGTPMTPDAYARAGSYSGGDCGGYATTSCGSYRGGCG
jgi:MoaA/NifB/PqqE/SkfB family radical SAM enzyme